MSVFPSDFDSDLEIPRIENDVSEIGGDVINSIRDAILAIEQSIGLNPQGSTADLVTRINRVIDSDGEIRISALEDHALVTLPIADIHVGQNAAISENKLSLDYGTTILNGKISTNITDLNTLRLAYNTFAAQSVNHFTGVSNRHDGSHIDLETAIRSSDDVETALHAVNDALTDHEGATSNAHPASSISSTNEFVNFDADNVQGALVALDNIGTNSGQDHQDSMHNNGIALNTRGEQNGQGNLAETVLAGTIYQTDITKATNILQTMRPNVARVSSKNIELRALKIASSQYLRIQAGGVNRGTLDVNLASVIPTNDIDQIVYAINFAAQGGNEHYPISAYNIGGTLTIAHNIPGKPFTVQILDSIQYSAATALGFGEVLSTIFEWSGTAHAGYVGGKSVTDLKSLVKVFHNHTVTSSTIALGLGDLAEYGITTGDLGRILCNITNHSTDATVNGTYYILSYPTNATFVLNDSIPLGMFDIEIVADSVNFTNTTNGELFDIFVEADTDGYGVVTKSSRVTYGPISGVDLKSISKDFSTTETAWQVIDASSIVIHQNGSNGIATDIPTGFQGQLKVFAPDNVNSALFEVTTIPSSSRRSMNVSTFAGTDDRLYIASVHYAGNHGLYTLRYAVDHRNIGATVESISEDELAPVQLEDTIKELRNNGVVRGLDILSQGDSSFRIRGGRAIIDGRIVDIETQDITVNDFSDAKKLLLLDKYGNFLIKSEFDSGFSFEELTTGDSYGDDQGLAIICEFETDGLIIDGYFSDRRLMVNKIDKRVDDLRGSLEQQIGEVRSAVSGSMWGFTMAESGIAGDGYLASIEMSAHNGFEYIPYANETPYSAYGFGGGNPLIETRRFEFQDSDLIKTSIFRAIGLTHINIFVQVSYTGLSGGPFGVSGEVGIEVGIVVETGMDSITSNDDYARVKTVHTGVLPVNSQVEQYVGSIPVSRLALPENVMFDFVPRIRIVGCHFVDGGGGADAEPTIICDNVRIVLSSYSIAGAINNVDGSTASIGATVGEIL